MKKLLFLLLTAGFGSCLLAQTVTQKTTTTKTKTTGNTISQPNNFKPAGDKNIPVPKLPDLRITSLDVKFYNSTSTDSTHRYLIVNYTLKNEGTTDVKLFDVNMQGFVTSNFEHTSGPGGGAMPASLKMTDILKPGASYNGSFQTSGSTILVPYAKFYRLYVDYGNAIKEINENNNNIATAIMMQ